MLNSGFENFPTFLSSSPSPQGAACKQTYLNFSPLLTESNFPPGRPTHHLSNIYFTFPDFQVPALGAYLITSFTPFGRSGRVTHATVCLKSIFLIFLFQIFSGLFDASGSMIPLSVSEIHCTRGFCDEQDEQQDEELGILVVGFSDPIESCCARKQ